MPEPSDGASFGASSADGPSWTTTVCTRRRTPSWSSKSAFVSANAAPAAASAADAPPRAATKPWSRTTPALSSTGDAGQPGSRPYGGAAETSCSARERAREEAGREATAMGWIGEAALVRVAVIE